MTAKSQKVVIALRMAGIAGQEKLHGIFEHLENGHRWTISLYRAPNEFTPQVVRQHLRSGVDGFIVGLPDAEAALGELVSTKIPTIAMNIALGPLQRRRRNLFIIKGDGRSIGNEAANEFLRHGHFRSFGYIPYIHDTDWSNDRCNGYLQRLKARGKAVAVYKYRRPLMDYLSALERPSAIFASCDDDAFKVLNVCRENGIRVPDEIAVLGVNNDVILCENALPRLSSIRPDNVGEGKMAARLLEKMMQDYRRNPNLNQSVRIHLMPFKDLVPRDSTPTESVSDVLIRKATDFIDRRACDAISVLHVANYAGVSRSLLDLRFRQHLKTSVYRMILKRRLESAKRLLCETRKPVSQIAAACGWTNERSMMNAFRRVFGVSPGVWRKRGCPLF